MDDVKRKKAYELLDEYLELFVGDRRDFLARHCGGDPELAHEIKRLAGFQGVADSLFDHIASVTPPTRSDQEDEAPHRAEKAGPALNESDDAPPHIVGYEIEGLVGQGGMGPVFRARQVSTGQRVALKVIRPDMATRDILKRLENEKAALAALDLSLPKIPSAAKGATRPAERRSGSGGIHGGCTRSSRQ